MSVPDLPLRLGVLKHRAPFVRRGEVGHLSAKTFFTMGCNFNILTIPRFPEHACLTACRPTGSTSFSVQLRVLIANLAEDLVCPKSGTVWCPFYIQLYSKVWKYQSGNQKSNIDEEPRIQWLKTNKQWSKHHTLYRKPRRATAIPLLQLTRSELRCNRRISSFCSPLVASVVLLIIVEIENNFKQSLL